MKRLDRAYTNVLRVAVMTLAGISGLAVIGMVAVTCVDVVFRISGHALTGAYDIVRIAGVIAIASALPYTTAVKGHVAIEFFFQKMRRTGRIVVDSVCRILVGCFFGVLTWQCVVYGNKLKQAGEVSLTLQIPMFWVAYVIALCCAVTVLVKIYNLSHPGREMIKP